MICSLVDDELLTQGEVLEGELTLATEDVGDESKHVKEDSDHRAGIVAGSRPTDQQVDFFGEGQGERFP
jgi:hypothetical protein